MTYNPKVPPPEDDGPPRLAVALHGSNVCERCKFPRRENGNLPKLPPREGYIAGNSGGEAFAVKALFPNHPGVYCPVQSRRVQPFNTCRAWAPIRPPENRPVVKG